MKIMVKTNSSVFQPNYFMQWSCVHNIWFPAASLHNLPWCSSCLYLPYCDINLSAVFKVCYQQWSMTASHKQVRRFALLFSLMSWLKGLFPWLSGEKQVWLSAIHSILLFLFLSSIWLEIIWHIIWKQ